MSKIPDIVQGVHFNHFYAQFLDACCVSLNNQVNNKLTCSCLSLHTFIPI